MHQVLFVVAVSVISIFSSSDAHNVMNHGHMDGMDDMQDMDMPGMHNKSDNSSGRGMGMSMQMTFYTGVEVTILFSEWKVSSVSGLIGSMVGIFLLAMIYEGIKFLREFLFKKYLTSLQYSNVAVTGNQSPQITQIQRVQRNKILSWPHAIQTVFHIVQIVISYFLMLIFMTYNVWLCLAVVLGAGVGFFVFGWKKASVVDVTEHCH